MALLPFIVPIQRTHVMAYMPKRLPEAPSELLVPGDEGDVSGARYCFHSEAAKSNDDYFLNVVRRRRGGDWVV